MEPPKRNRPKILAIDDEPGLRSLIQMTLSREYDVVTADNGEAGVAAAKKEVPDLILCDVVLPGMTGSEVLRHLQVDPALSYIPVIMMTGATLDPVTVSMFQQHPNFRQWLRKPFTVESLIKAAAKELAARTPARFIPPPRPRSGADAGPGPRRQQRILIIEHDVPFFEFLSLSMHPEDLILRAADGKEALDRIRDFKPDLILANLEAFTAGDVLSKSLQRLPESRDVPVILMAPGRATLEQRAAAYAACPNLKTILEKPFDVGALRKSVDSLLIRDLAS